MHAYLEAIRIAKFTAALDAAYNQPTYLFFAPNLSSSYFIPKISNNLLENLNEKEQNIKYTLNEITGNNVIWSWIPQKIQDLFFTREQEHLDTIETSVSVNHFDLDVTNDENNYKEIPDNIMLMILKNYDYKQKINPRFAANLLVQQCFLAQQEEPIKYKIDLQNNFIITGTSYIYDRFFTVDGICTEIIQNQNQNHITPVQAHLDFIAVRKAVQTALFIANKNSVFYLGYILPTTFTQYLDSIIYELMIYDAKLSRYCKDPRYGATKDDLYKDILWTRISYAAAGIAATAIITTDYQYGVGTSVKWLFNGLFDIGKKALGYTQDSEKNNKKEDSYAQNLTPQEKLKKAQEQLSKAQQAERKIYEDAITQQKKNLETVMNQKELEEEKLHKLDLILKQIITQQPTTFLKSNPHRTDSEDIFIIDQQKVEKAQKTSEKKLTSLKKEAASSPKTEAALARKIKEIELEQANYEMILHTIKEKENTEIVLQKINQIANQESNKLTKAQEEYSRGKGWFGRWNGAEIDLKNMTEKEQEEYTQALNKGFINPLKEIISSNENNLIKNDKFEKFNDYHQQFQQALDKNTKRVNDFVTNKQKLNNEYYAGLTTEEKKADALWNALATNDYTIDPNSKTYAYNEKESRNIATGLTPQENFEFAPYAAGALVAGVAPLTGAAIQGSINSIGTAAQQGINQGFANYARTAAFAEKIGTQTPKIVPTKTVNQKITQSTSLGGTSTIRTENSAQ